MFLRPLRWMHIGIKVKIGWRFDLGNLLWMEGFPERVSKFCKFFKHSLFKLLHVGHEFVTCTT
jgi:hypothetical protein